VTYPATLAEGMLRVMVLKWGEEIPEKTARYIYLFFFSYNHIAHILKVAFAFITSHYLGKVYILYAKLICN